MSLRYEQYRSLKQTREFLHELITGPRMPTMIQREKARDCARHFPPLNEHGKPSWSQDDFTTEDGDMANASARRRELDDARPWEMKVKNAGSHRQEEG